MTQAVRAFALFAAREALCTGAPFAAFSAIDTGADGDGGDDTVRVEFGAGKVEEMDAADYFGAVHAAIAAADATTHLHAPASSSSSNSPGSHSY